MKEGTPTDDPTEASSADPTDCIVNQLDVTSIEAPSNAFIGCASSADMCPDPDEPTMPDLATVETPVITNKNEDGLDIKPNFIVSHDSPTNEEVRALIDSGANATVTNMLGCPHKVHFCAKDRPCRKHMCGATAGKTKMTPSQKDIYGSQLLPSKVMLMSNAIIIRPSLLPF